MIIFICLTRNHKMEDHIHLGSLVRRGVALDSYCSMCVRKYETSMHLFWECKVVMKDHGSSDGLGASTWSYGRS
ncbi:unnamed protein product [Citrullus colocynthis]|uniref:Reverse transcriptase zinc-binding domain-containing protein n=1 Tax=Citrullus colocynthis TaxID=252529 RepID=A0ABP0XRE5_9ROSI